MQYLREIAEQLQVFGRHALFYLAAAVSDFYIPWSEMVRHLLHVRVHSMYDGAVAAGCWSLESAVLL